MKKFFYKYWHILALAALALAPFLWLNDGDIIYGPDTMWSINGSDTYSTLVPTWKNDNGFGYGWSDSGRIIHNIFVTLLRHLGISYSVSQKIILCVLIFFCAYFTYLLSMQLLKSNPSKARIYSIIASFIFVLNPFAMTWVWWRFLGVMYAYPCWPLLFYVVTRIVNDNISRRQLILFAGIFSLFAPGVSAPILLLTLYAGAILYFSLRIILAQDSRKLDQIKNFIFFSTIYLLINAYWLLPGILLLNHSISSALTAYDPNAAFIFNSQYSTVYNTIKLWGASALHISFFGQKYFGKGIANILSNGIIQTVLLLPFVGVVTILFSRRNLSTKDKQVGLSMAVVVIIGIFMMKAGSAPLAFINKETLKLPLGAAFRIPYDKFGYFVAIGYAILTPFALETFKNKFAKRVYILFLFFYIAIPLAIFFTPHAFLDNDKSSLKGVVAQVPAEYSQLSNLGFNKDNRVLILPTAYNGESSYNWPKGVQTNSHDILSDYIPSQIVFLPNGNDYSDKTKNNLTTELFSGLYDEQTINLVLQKYGIDHIFIHKDWNAGFMLNKEPLPAHYIDLVKSLPNVKVAENNKYYTLYTLTNKNVTKINVVNSAVAANTNFSNQLGTAAAVSNVFGQNADFKSVSNKDGSQIVNLGDPSINGNILTYAFNLKRSTNSLYVNTSIMSRFKNPISLRIDGKSLNLSDVVRAGNVDSYKINLPAGKHELSLINLERVTIYDQNLNNVKNDLSIDWECGKKFKDSIGQSYDATRMFNYFSLTSTLEYASCHMLYVTNIEPNSNAILSFKYKTKYPTGARVVVYEDNKGKGHGNTSQVVNQEIQSSTSWASDTVSFHTQVNHEYRPIFYSGLNDGVKSETYYADLQGVSVPAGFSQMLTLIDGSQVQTNGSRPVISSTKNYEENTLFSVQVNSNKPYILNDNHSYDPYWRAYIAPSNWSPNILDKILGPTGLYKIPDSSHVVMNGYSNGWEIPITSNTQKIVFEYWPQRLFYLGLSITVTALLSIGIFLALNTRKKSGV